MHTQITRRRALRTGALRAALSISLSMTGCPRMPGDIPVVKPGDYGDSPAELERLWRALLAASQRDDRQAVHALLSSMVLTREELAELIGPARAERMWARYQALGKQLVGPTGVELCGYVYERTYDDITVSRVDTLPPAELSEEDAAMMRSLKGPVPIYAVRVKRKQESRGLHYGFFVYRNGHWRTGYLLGKYLPAVLETQPVSQ
jgi:hypothetical protein